MATLTQTTLSAAITAKQTVIPLTSVTGISAGAVTSGTVGTRLYVVDPGGGVGEVMDVLSVSGTNVTVTRIPSAAVAHISGAMVLAGQPQQFQSTDPTGSTNGPDTPFVNVLNGRMWLFSSITSSWVPGFWNPLPAVPTVAVASAAGAILPSGPLFHVTGTAAITGFTIPVGGVGAPFTIIPDGAATFTTAGNIALAGTMVVNRAMTFIWDSTNSKYVPSYV